MVSPLARRSAVKYLVKQRRSSQRHACVVVGLSRSLVSYIARRRRDEAELIKKIHKLAIRHSRYGYRSDNGPEFISKAVCQWLKESGCQTLFIKPGSPWENGYIESFNDKLRDECLNREVFRNGKEAQATVENWRQEYNNCRPHST